MPYTTNEEKVFPDSADAVYAAVKAAVAGLEGKVLSEDADAKQLKVQFHKTIHGKVLGDRSVFQTQIEENGEGTKLLVEGFPVDAVGRKLMFGARKGVTRTVMNWFWAHIDHNLKKE
ncbi:MAG: hypothetical protein JXB38_03720 [Anaerolineales bacterium]|nr:hypothetical protein [Anaerolineales bacterium]